MDFIDNFKLRFSLRGATAAERGELQAERATLASSKWLPVIDTESCGGCGRCVEVCADGCLEMIWAFATLTQPEDCTSCELCMDACCEEVISMDWIARDGDLSVGRWHE